jgi:putative ABC transport system substrate-binding protein
MRRRDFVALLSGAAAWSVTARAQQSPIRPLIGVLSPLSAAEGVQNTNAFRSALRELGYIEGRNATVELRYANGEADRMGALTRELVALKPDVLFVGSAPGLVAARNATRTIPIVTIVPEDPVASGIASSIARPSGNITGTWSLGDYALVGKRLDFLKLAVPRLARVAAIVNPDDPTDRMEMTQLPKAASGLGLALQFIEVHNAAELESAAAEVVRAGVQGMYLSQGPTLSRRQIAAMMERLKLPAIHGFRTFVDTGGLLSYGPNLPELYRQSARLVDRILKGEKPGDLPFELPTRYELIVNLKAAKAIGLTIPDSFVLLADEVIE